MATFQIQELTEGTKPATGKGVDLKLETLSGENKLHTVTGKIPRIR
jgi:hypothetical protein